MSAKPSLFAELRRRNVPRAAVLYAGAAWALAQGIAQLGPVAGAPDWVARWFLIAAAIGFPFWIAFAWFYELTPHGLRREAEVAPADPGARSNRRKLDKWIIAVLAVAVVLLLTNTFVMHKGAGLSRDAATDSAGIPSKSIAVLPLSNEGANKGDLYFSDGLSEDLITALSQFAGLKVISRNSSFQFRDSKLSSAEIGGKLGVAHLLEGSVQRAGGMVRISAILVNAADGSIVWSQRYDRPYRDLFTLQDDITRSIAAALQAKLLQANAAAQNDRPPGGSLEAWQDFQRGKFFYERRTQADYVKAVEQFTAATRLDPRYAAAYAGLSRVQTALGSEILDGAAQQQAYDQARAAADTALALAPDMAAAHTAKGELLYNADLNLGAAQAVYQRVLELAPNDAEALFFLGTVVAAQGRPDSAAEMTRKALTIDPLRSRWYGQLGLYLMATGHLDEAEQVERKAIALQPGANGYYQRLAKIAILRGDARGALEAANQEITGGWKATALALALQIGSDRAAADAALKALIDGYAQTSAYQVAEVYALRRDPDHMFEWLDRAWTNRDAGIPYLLYDPFPLRYKDDPRFVAFCKKVGLPATTDALAMP